jgi:hypothetical protein
VVIDYITGLMYAALDSWIKAVQLGSALHDCSVLGDQTNNESYAFY